MNQFPTQWQITTEEHSNRGVFAKGYPRPNITPRSQAIRGNRDRK